MTTIALPDFFFDPGSFGMEMPPVQRSNGSPFGGSEQVVDLLNERWNASLSIPPRTKGDAAAVEAFVASMRGLNNTIQLYHLARPTPRGTLRGSPTAAAAAQGAGQLVIHGAAGFTLLAGDMLGVGGLLLMVASDCVADGSGNATVPLANRLRRAISSSAVVTWDRPTAPFRLLTTAGIQYLPGYAESSSFDFVEAIV